MPYEIGSRSQSVAMRLPDKTTLYEVRPVIATDAELAARRSLALIKILVSAVALAVCYIPNPVILAVLPVGPAIPWWVWVWVVWPAWLLGSIIQGLVWLGWSMRGVLDARVGPCPHCGKETHTPVPGRRFFRCEGCSGGIRADQESPIYRASGRFVAV